MPQFNEKEKHDKIRLDVFDESYFRKLEGEDGWIAIGQKNCSNQKYFTVKGEDNEILGIIGVYDTDDEKNIAHTVIDPKHRGKGLSGKLKKILMDKLNLEFLTLTIDLSNTASIRSAEKTPNTEKTSDKQYENEFHKVKFQVHKEKDEEK